MVFKRHLVFYFLFSAAGSFFLIFLGGENGWLYAPHILLWILLCAIVFVLLDHRKITGIWRRAQAQCRPDQAVTAYYPLVAKGRRRILRHAGLMTHCSAALIEAGQPQEALQVLDALQQNLKGKRLERAWPVILNNRCSALLQLGRTVEAGPLLAQLAQYMQSGKCEKVGGQNMNRVMETHVVLLLFVDGILTGNTEGAAAYLIKLLETQSAPLNRAHTLYYLGLVYEMQAQPATALNCFTDAVRLGGSGWCAQRSRAKLQGHGAPVPAAEMPTALPTA